MKDRVEFILDLLEETKWCHAQWIHFYQSASETFSEPYVATHGDMDFHKKAVNEYDNAIEALKKVKAQYEQDISSNPQL